MLSILYGGHINEGDTLLRNYKSFTMESFTNELRIRTLMTKARRERIERKSKEEMERKQNELLRKLAGL